MRSKDMKLGEEELVLKTNIKKESPWLYYLDKDGDKFDEVYPEID